MERESKEELKCLSKIHQSKHQAIQLKLHFSWKTKEKEEKLIKLIQRIKSEAQRKEKDKEKNKENKNNKREKKINNPHLKLKEY